MIGIGHERMGKDLHIALGKMGSGTVWVGLATVVFFANTTCRCCDNMEIIAEFNLLGFLGEASS